MANRGFKVPLAARIFLASAVLVSIAVVLAAVVTLQQGKRSGDRAVSESLKGAGQAQAMLEASAFSQLDVIALSLSRDADFARYLAAATDDGLGLGESDSPPGLDDSAAISNDPAAATDAVPPPEEPTPVVDEPAIDSSSVSDLLKEMSEAYGFKFGMVLDSEGSVVARTDEREAFQDSFADDPLFATVINDLAGVTGYWRDGVSLYQVSVRPIGLQDELVGFIIIGKPVDATVASDVKGASRAEVAYWLLDGEELRPVASSLPADAEASLKESLIPIKPQAKSMLASGTGLDRLDVAIAKRKYAGALAPLFGQPGQAVGGVITLTSVDDAMAPFISIQNAVMIGGLVALVLALAVSWWLARRVLRPVAELTDVVELAAGGNYSQELDIAGNDEVARLGRAFDLLLSDLREKKDMEGYVGHVSRFLPDPVNEEPAAPARPAPKPAVRRDAVLVGLELRRFLKAPTKGEEAITLTALGQLVEEALARAGVAGGELLEQEGPRLMFGFTGESPELRALATVHFWMEGRIGVAENGAAAAIASGEIVHGSLPSRPESTATIGLPVLQVERLLAETPIGSTLLAPALGEKLKAIGQVAVLKVANGQSSGKRFLAVEREGLSVLAKIAPGLSQPTQMAGAPLNATLIPGAILGSPNDHASTRLATGMRFAGRYEILAILGAGGMGMVYKARDVELSDIVALKMLRPGMLVDAEQLDRLKSELKLARKITHPNVLRTYDFGDFQGVPYISMEYVRGLTLRHLLQQAGKLPFSAALRIARQLCMGLDAAHQVGVIHRDIKPENIIIEQSGNAKLMDFGIARPARRADPGHTQPGTFLGTPNYASPEQLSGMDLDQRSDIYSTGVMLCEMFCGKLPFSGGNTMELYVAHLQQPPIKPSALWTDIPKPLEEVILKCLEKKPSDRYATASDLLVGLSVLRA